MSSDSDRVFTVLWVPDMASQTGWAGKRVMLGREEIQRARRPRRSIGFQRQDDRGRAEVE